MLDFAFSYFVAFAGFCLSERDERGKIKVGTAKAFDFRKAYVAEHGDGGLGLWKIARVEAEAKSFAKQASDTKNIGMMIFLSGGPTGRSTDQGREICRHLQSII